MFDVKKLKTCEWSFCMSCGSEITDESISIQIRQGSVSPPHNFPKGHEYIVPDSICIDCAIAIGRSAHKHKHPEKHVES